jgi:hypothetical protein
MINAGLDLGTLFGVTHGSRDYFGNPLPQGGSYDIGAHELGAPSVSSIASASQNPATHGTSELSVTGADEAGEANLLYTWNAIGTSPASVSFSENGMNAAKNTSVSFSKAGAYSFAVTITNTAGLSATSSVAVEVDQTFEFWLAENGLIGSDALPDADPHGLGVGNLLAYAFGIESNASSVDASLPAVTRQDGLLTLNYDALRSDVIYQPEWSLDFSGWSTAGISISSNGTSRVASIPIGTDRRKFMRVRIIR